MRIDKSIFQRRKIVAVLPVGVSTFMEFDERDSKSLYTPRSMHFGKTINMHMDTYMSILYLPNPSAI